MFLYFNVISVVFGNVLVKLYQVNNYDGGNVFFNYLVYILC